MVTRETIVKSLREMGVKPGDVLLAHSSYKSFGGVDGGPFAVAQALVDAVSPGGIAMVPTFTFGRGVYDATKTLSLTGAICDAFWQMPGAVRSLQPTHPFAAYGLGAAELLEGHEKVHPFGLGSPIHKLWERNGWVLLMGVDHRRSSSLHVAEELVEVEHINRTRVVPFVRNGVVEEKIVRRPGCSEGYNNVEPILRQRGQIIEKMVGESKFLLMRSRDLVGAAVEMLRRDPTSLCCNSPECVRCNWAKSLAAKAVA